MGREGNGEAGDCGFDCVSIIFMSFSWVSPNCGLNMCSLSVVNFHVEGKLFPSTVAVLLLEEVGVGVDFCVAVCMGAVVTLVV